jgi:hypothetical protein
LVFCGHVAVGAGWKRSIKHEDEEFSGSVISMSGTKRGTAGILARAAAALLVIASPAALYAQSCAMCYQSAAASGPRSIHALKLGILILMFPPLLITAGVFYLAYTKRDQFNQNS